VAVAAANALDASNTAVTRTEAACVCSDARWLPAKRGIDGLAKGVPQLLVQAALQRHAVRLGLPALLQGLDLRIHAHNRRVA